LQISEILLLLDWKLEVNLVFSAITRFLAIFY
jgi:hypothetical protein